MNLPPTPNYEQPADDTTEATEQERKSKYFELKLFWS